MARFEESERHYLVEYEKAKSYYLRVAAFYGLVKQQYMIK